MSPLNIDTDEQATRVVEAANLHGIRAVNRALLAGAVINAANVYVEGESFTDNFSPAAARSPPEKF